MGQVPGPVVNQILANQKTNKNKQMALTRTLSFFIFQKHLKVLNGAIAQERKEFFIFLISPYKPLLYVFSFSRFLKRKRGKIVSINCKR